MSEMVFEVIVSLSTVWSICRDVSPVKESCASSGVRLFHG